MMRSIFTLVALGLAGACSAQPGGNTGEAPHRDAARSAVPASITLTASDGVKVYGDYYAAAHPKALILLFHQAGSSAAEYATIAPRLVAMGYSALAIDQRSGGNMFGPNRTAASAGTVPEGPAGYRAAEADLQAALDWAESKDLPVIAWGSSYSSALVFLLAAQNPGKIKALLSFSPGEYLGGDHIVRDAAAKIAIPVFVTSASPSDNADAAKAIFDAVPANPANTRYMPKHGVHGSSTLIAARDPQGAADNWAAVSAFLKRVAP